MLGFTALATGALLFAPGPDPFWRAVGAALSLGLGGPPVRSLIFNRGPKSVRRVTWHPDGTWSIQSGRREFNVRLIPPTSALGGFILLAWWNPLVGRRYALVEERCIGEATFRRLKGRLRVEKG